MGPEGAVNIIFRKQIEAAEDPDATRAQMIEGIRQTIDPYIAAGNALIDDVIDPRETRPTVIRALEMAETKRVQRPWKKHTGKPSLTWSEAVDQALCFGWIDGRVNRIDEERHMQRFTPRRPNSNWSNVNVAKVERLIEEGLMRPAGLAAFGLRKEAKTGVYSYERPK